jgi:hypothetical protein
MLSTEIYFMDYKKENIGKEKRVLLHLKLVGLLGCV